MGDGYDITMKAIMGFSILMLVGLLALLIVKLVGDSNILKQETIGYVEYTVVETDKHTSTHLVPVTIGKTTTLQPRTRTDYNTILKGESGKLYKVESRALYDYCKINQTVTIEVKEYKEEQHQCFGNNVLYFKLLK